MQQPDITKVVITGITSGLGREIGYALNRLHSTKRQFYITGFDKDHWAGDPPPCDTFKMLDLRFAAQVQIACREIGECDILVNCAGINGIDWLENLELDMWEDVMNVNARSIYLMAQGLLPQLIRSKGTILNIISNASHMPMTNSLAYNASKGAAHIMTLQLARELTRRHGITVFGISPNKLAGTGMSRYIEDRVPEMRGWHKEQAEAYQRAALLTGEETDPYQLAEFIGYLLSFKERHKFLAGCVLPYGA